MIKVHYSTFDYSNISETKYRYKLEGLNKNWIETDKNNLIYSTIHHGSYTLRIQAQNTLGQWVSEKTIAIKILPPYWKTWWAYIFYLLLTLSFFWAFMKYREIKKNHFIASMELKVIEKDTELKIHEARETERERIRKQAAADFHDELGHRLTKISLLSNMASSKLEDKDEKQKSYLQKINRHAQDTYSEMKEFIWVLNPDQDTLFDVITHLKDFGEELYDETDITFLSHEIPEELNSKKLSSEHKKHLFLLFKEAMNNSLKHSNATKIELKSELNGLEFKLILDDNGVGFIKENISNNSYGFTSMNHRATELNAELNITSAPDHGTRMTISMTLN